VVRNNLQNNQEGGGGIVINNCTVWWMLGVVVGLLFGTIIGLFMYKDLNKEAGR